MYKKELVYFPYESIGHFRFYQAEANARKWSAHFEHKRAASEKVALIN